MGLLSIAKTRGKCGRRSDVSDSLIEPSNNDNTKMQLKDILTIMLQTYEPYNDDNTKTQALTPSNKNIKMLMLEPCSADNIIISKIGNKDAHNDGMLI